MSYPQQQAPYYGSPQPVYGATPVYQPSPVMVVNTGAAPVHTPMPMPILDKEPARMCCPYCRTETSTRVEYENGTLVWLLAAGLCLFTGCCCWIPFVVDGCKDVKHHCGNCGQVVGTYRRI